MSGQTERRVVTGVRGYDPYHPDRRMALPRITMPPSEEGDEWLTRLCEQPWLLGPSSLWQHTSQGVRLRDDD